MILLIYNLIYVPGLEWWNCSNCSKMGGSMQLWTRRWTEQNWRNLCKFWEFHFDNTEDPISISVWHLFFYFNHFIFRLDRMLSGVPAPLKAHLMLSWAVLMELLMLGTMRLRILDLTLITLIPFSKYPTPQFTCPTVASLFWVVS